MEETPDEPYVLPDKPAVGKPALVSDPALATPSVRALAKELGVDVNKVAGTGPEGRVLEKDVRQAVEGKAKPAEPEKKPAKGKKYDFYGYVDRIPLSEVRRSIAKAMAKSK